jgi:hypothetical protein
MGAFRHAKSGILGGIVMDRWHYYDNQRNTLL